MENNGYAVGDKVTHQDDNGATRTGTVVMIQADRRGNGHTLTLQDDSGNMWTHKV